MYVGAALLGLGMFMGHIIAGIIFFGILSAASIIFLVESNKEFKMFCGKYGFILDLFLFVLSAMAVAYLGVTVAGGLAVASLIFTVYRLNFLKPWYDSVKEKGKSIKQYLAEGFNNVCSFFGFGTKKSEPCVEA